MNLIDPQFLEDKQLIIQYVIECRGRGHFLPYSDYHTISIWFQLCPDVDRLLLILSEILPEFFARYQDRPTVPGLKGVDARVKRCLLNQRYQSPNPRNLDHL